MVKLNLKIKDRILIDNFYPEMGSRTEMLIKRELRNMFTVTSTEMDEIGWREVFDSTLNKSFFKWDQEKDTGKEFTLSLTAATHLKEWAIAMDASKRLTEEMLDLFDKLNEL